MSVLFSVIVPVYNKEKYIKECVNSILLQSYKDFELILVDDGSTDGCPLICDDYSKSDERVKVIHKENGGLVSARKEGFRHSIGEYIVCVDADDYVEKNYLFNLKKEIDNNRPDIICASYSVLNKRKKKIDLGFKKGFFNKKEIISTIFPYLIQYKNTDHFPVNIWAKAYKRGLYSSTQMDVDDSVNIGEDGCVTIPCLYFANSLSIIDDYSYVYRMNDDSMTNKDRVLDSYYPKKVLKHLEKVIDINKYDLKEQSYRYIVHQLFTISLSFFNLDKSYKEIKNMIINLLDDSLYKESINKAQFDGNFIAGLMLFILKNKFIYIIYLVSGIY